MENSWIFKPYEKNSEMCEMFQALNDDCIGTILVLRVIFINLCIILLATTFGDPHLVTLDGFSYTFNGHGEYTMLNIAEIGFEFQARMQPLKRKGKNSRGTFLMAFVLRDEDSDTVQVGRMLWRTAVG